MHSLNPHLIRRICNTNKCNEKRKLVNARTDISSTCNVLVQKCPGFARIILITFIILQKGTQLKEASSFASQYPGVVLFGNNLLGFLTIFKIFVKIRSSKAIKRRVPLRDLFQIIFCTVNILYLDNTFMQSSNWTDYCLTFRPRTLALHKGR